MKKNTILTVFLICNCCIGMSQVTFEKVYGGMQKEWGMTGIPTSDGGYICTGLTRSYGAGGDDVYIVKTDMYGDSLWTRTYGGSQNDLGQTLIQALGGGYVICGYTNSYGSGNNDAYIIRIDGNGDTIWTRTFGGPAAEVAYGILQMPDSSYLFTGSTMSYGYGDEDLTLTKISKDGAFLWSKNYGGTSADRGFRLIQTFDSGYVITGMTCSFGSGNCDIYLIKTDINGDTIWTRAYGGSGTDFGADVVQCPDSGYMVSGSSGSFGPGNSEVFIVRTDKNGDTLWTTTAGGPNNDYGHGVIMTSDGGYAVIAQTEVPPFFVADCFLIKLDSSGAISWTKTYGSANAPDFSNDIQQTPDGGYFITATGTHQDFDVLIIKTDANGNTSSVGTDENPSAPLHISPNPCNGILRINFGFHLQRIEVVDIMGRIVFSEELSSDHQNNTTIDLSIIPPGIYLLIANGNNTSAVRKFVRM